MSRAGAGSKKGGQGVVPSGPGSLDGVFRPGSIAVIGASRRPQGIGHEVVRNLVFGGFTGPVYPVNPKADVVLSMKCYPSLAAIPGPVDLAVLVIPAEHVLKAVRACAKKGVRGLVIITAGFREIGGEGIERERAIVSLARRHGMRIIGPNCMGIVNTEEGVSLNASFAAERPIPGGIAFVSQSGALGEAILAEARRAELGLRMFASVGNRADIGAHDLLEYWEHDDGVRLILLYLESFGDPTRFKVVAERLRGKKTIVAVKAGRSAAGARAAGSHTGSVTGEDRVADTFMAQCGVLRAADLRQMFAYAEGLLHQPVPAGDRVAVVTNAGGPGILATDAIDGLGLELATFSARTRSRLERSLPAEASLANPVDMIASADAERYRKVLQAVVADPGVDALIVLFVSPIMIDASAVAAAIVETTRERGKPVTCCLMGRIGTEEARRRLKDAGIPLFDFPEEAARTLAGIVRSAQLSRRRPGKVKSYDIDTNRVRRLLGKHRRSGGGWMAGESVRRIMEVYGLPMIPTAFAKDAAGALVAARSVGYPVCLKASSATLVHKSDHGGVKVGLADDDGVQAAAAEMIATLGRAHGDLRIEVQAMARGHREMLLGFRRDPRFGPQLAIGFGGIAVEVLKDVAVRAGPLFDSDPGEMLDSLRGAPLLDDFRGQPAVDRDLLVDCLLRLSQLAEQHLDILELDLNPFIASAPGESSWIVDARIRTEPLDS